MTAPQRFAWPAGFTTTLLPAARAARVEPAGIEQRVHPTMVPKSSAIAQVMGVTNAVTIDADAVGELTLIGPGAGGEATASAVFGDIADVARRIVRPTFGTDAARMAPPSRAEMQRHEGGYYIRLTVHDRVGVFASIARRMAESAISLESIVQRKRAGHESDEVAPVILITHETTEAAVRKAIDAISRDGHLSGEPRMIRIEPLD